MFLQIVSILTKMQMPLFYKFKQLVFVIFHLPCTFIKNIKLFLEDVLRNNSPFFFFFFVSKVVGISSYLCSVQRYLKHKIRFKDSLCDCAHEFNFYSNYLENWNSFK